MSQAIPDPEKECEDALSRSDALCKHADALRLQGLLGPASEVLERILKLDPQSYEACLALAQIRRAQGRLKEAIAHLANLTQQYPDQPAPWEMLSVTLLEAGRSADALASMEHLAALLPHDMVAQIRCAKLALELGDCVKAAHLIARVRSADPENAAARFLEGLALFEDGRTESAIDVYRDAVRMAPHLGEPTGGRIVEAWMMAFPSWAGTDSGKYRMLAPPLTLKLPQPTVIPAEESHYWVMQTEQIPEVFMGRIENAEVLTPEFPVLASDGCFFVEGYVTSPKVYPHKGGVVKYVGSDARLLLDLPLAPMELDVECILLGRSNNYYHFLFESLVRIWCVEQAGINNKVPALVPQDLYPTQLELLALLGFPESKLIPVPNGTSVRCHTLHAPSLLSQGYMVLPLAVQFLRERVLTRVANIPDLPQRVYLSRNRMPKRHVCNEADLLPVLERHGFRIIYPEELGLAEQVQLFAHAKAILSPDSSALANLAFATPETKVGVFNWRGIHKPLWHCIAFHVGARLTYIHADPVVESHAALAHRDMRVDVALLDAWLHTL